MLYFLIFVKNAISLPHYSCQSSYVAVAEQDTHFSILVTIHACLVISCPSILNQRNLLSTLSWQYWLLTTHSTLMSQIILKLLAVSYNVPISGGIPSFLTIFAPVSSLSSCNPPDFMVPFFSFSFLIFPFLLFKRFQAYISLISMI